MYLPRTSGPSYVILFAFAVVSLTGGACTRRDSGKLTELQRAGAGTLDVVLLAPEGVLRHGKDTFVIEFRGSSNGALVDVGTVHASATMPMGGTPMLGGIDVKRTEVPGRYEATADLSMAGTWRTTVDWNGPTGRGSVTFSGNVR